MVRYQQGVTTGEELYTIAWNQSKRFIDLFETNQDSDDDGGSEDDVADVMDHLSDADVVLQETKMNLSDDEKTTKPEKEEVPPETKALRWNLHDLPFQLVAVTESAMVCSHCGNSCSGCRIPNRRDPVILPRKQGQINLAVDWDEMVKAINHDEHEIMVSAV